MKTLPLASENPREQFLNTRSLTSKVCTWYQQESGHAMLGYPSHAECIHNMPPQLFDWNMQFSFVFGVPISITAIVKNCEQGVVITVK